MFLDAWKPDYKKFFEMVFPRVTPGGLFLAHNVINKKNDMLDFLRSIETHPQALTTTVSPGHEGISMTYKKRRQADRLEMRPSTSSACRSISAATGAAPTWGRRRFALPAFGEQLTALGLRGHRQG